MNKAEVIIIGSGIAALQLAKSLHSDRNVIILTKSNVFNSNSFLAQGGIAAAIGMKDHPEKHYQDTLEAGRYHNNPEVVIKVTEEAPKLIQNLIKEGCLFDRDEGGELLLGMEGAHSENRIVHGGGDATGKTITQFMTSQLNRNLEMVENIFVFELLMDKLQKRCIGVKGKFPDGRIESFFANHIVLATGGCGQLFAYTSNAKTVTGDGIALAYRAGAEITDMEFIQFHPTLLFTNGKAVGLVSEAVRGEGGRLVTAEGKEIMAGVHPLRDLAPRHIVSQTIYVYLKNGVQVYLDISSVENFSERFPTVTALCEKNGIKVSEGLIPVVPGSHFLMGGIKTDLIGRSSVEGLYAIGEAACTGVHGSNRLASNSLLEGLFFGKKLGEWLNTQPRIYPFQYEIYEFIKSLNSAVPLLPPSYMIQTSMMDNAGIMRTEKDLFNQKEWLETFNIGHWLNANLEELSTEEMSQVFMLLTAWLVTDSALQRTESRGGHFRKDYPCENNHEWLGKQIIQCRKIEKDEKHEQSEAAIAT